MSVFFKYKKSVNLSFELTLCICLIFCISIFQAGADSSNIDSLQITLETDINQLTPEDAIVSMTLKNNGPDTITLYQWKSQGGTIKGAIGAFLDFDIEKDSTETLICKPVGVMPKRPQAADTMILKPGQSYIESINLTSFYVQARIKDSIISDSTSSWGKRLWSPGLYMIRCKYEYNHQLNWKGGKNLCQGTVTSNAVIIQID